MVNICCATAATGEVYFWNSCKIVETQKDRLTPLQPDFLSWAHHTASRGGISCSAGRYAGEPAHTGLTARGRPETNKSTQRQILAQAWTDGQ